MDLRLSEEQQMLKKAAADFIATECSATLTRQLEESETGFSHDVWQKMGEPGWMGLAIPEKYHGASMSFQDLMVLEIGIQQENTSRNPNQIQKGVTWPNLM